MLSDQLIIFFVDSPEKSVNFYSKLLNINPIQQSPTFAMFKLPSGLMLGLWSKHTVEPTLEHWGNSVELAFTLPTEQEVEQCYQDWKNKDVTILQALSHTYFGYTFLAQDPDGHRLRPFMPQK